MKPRALVLVLWVLRLGLFGIYLFAAIPKVLDPWSFARAVANFRILPLAVVPAVALWLPILEGIAALAVLGGALYRGGVACLTLLSAAFAIGIGSAMARGLDIDCGCFGAAASSRANLAHLALNVACVAAGAVLLALARRGGRARPAP